MRCPGPHLTPHITGEAPGAPKAKISPSHTESRLKSKCSDTWATVHSVGPYMQVVPEGNWCKACGTRLPTFSPGVLSSAWETQSGGVRSHLWGDPGLMGQREAGAGEADDTG